MEWTPPTDYGLDEKQMRFLFELLSKALSTIDPREQHFLLVVLTREVSDDDGDLVSTNSVSSMDKEYLHDTLREWLHKETH